jgi:hypothetical protein
MSKTNKDVKMIDEVLFYRTLLMRLARKEPQSLVLYILNFSQCTHITY